MKDNKEPNPILHGENAIVPVDKMPNGDTEHYTKYIVGHSETGYHHVLEAAKGTTFDIIVDGQDIYFSTTGKAKIVHKKTHDVHKTEIVAPGIYRVNRKQEYDPFLQVRRQIWD